MRGRAGGISGLARTAGPGILFASTAIGVSHLIQSTRAGADFGMMMVAFVVLATVLKYPFFEYGSRYANATGTSIIDGYAQMGRPFLWMYLLLTVASMFFVTGAVGFVTAAFFENLFGAALGEWTVVLLFGACTAIIAVGRYGALDGMVKAVAAVLLVSTVAAFAMAAWNGPAAPAPGFEPEDLWTASGLFFLLALMGWMPTALDISSWNSLWTLERIRQSGYRPSLRETLLEFRLAYLATGVLAVMFVTLGAFIFHGTGEELPSGGPQFAHRVVTLYTETVGEWSGIVISASAFTVMFGTILAVFDGYSRSLRRAVWLAAGGARSMPHAPFLLALAGGSLAVIFGFGGSLVQLVDFATVLSFVIAPVIAVLNYRLVTGRLIGAGMGPPAWLRALSVAGIVFLAGFALVFAAARVHDVIV